MSVISLPRSLWTPFQEKSYELDLIKKRAYRLMGEFNAVVLEYRDWFNRRYQSFIDAIKRVQNEAPTLVPHEISNLTQLRRVYSVGQKLTRMGFVFRGKEHIEQFLGFWDELLRIKEYLDTDLLIEVTAFCTTIDTLRKPDLKKEIDDLHAELCERCIESFDFGQVRNEKDNLFIYKLSMADRRFIGLVGFIPYILDFATKVCFLIGKLFIERLSK